MAEDFPEDEISIDDFGDNPDQPEEEKPAESKKKEFKKLSKQLETFEKSINTSYQELQEAFKNALELKFEKHNYLYFQMSEVAEKTAEVQAEVESSVKELSGQLEQAGEAFDTFYKDVKKINRMAASVTAFSWVKMIGCFVGGGSFATALCLYFFKIKGL